MAWDNKEVFSSKGGRSKKTFNVELSIEGISELNQDIEFNSTKENESFGRCVFCDTPLNDSCTSCIYCGEGIENA